MYKEELFLCMYLVVVCNRNSMKQKLPIHESICRDQIAKMKKVITTTSKIIRFAIDGIAFTLYCCAAKIEQFILKLMLWA